MKARPVYSYIQLLKPHTLNVRKSSNIVMHSVVTLFNFPVFQHWEELKIYYMAQNFQGVKIATCIASKDYMSIHRPSNLSHLQTWIYIFQNSNTYPTLTIEVLHVVSFPDYSFRARQERNVVSRLCCARV